jgi:DNA processing protein
MLLENQASYFDKVAELAFIRTNESCGAFSRRNYPERLKHCIDGPLYYLLLDKLIKKTEECQITSYGTEFCGN